MPRKKTTKNTVKKVKTEKEPIKVVVEQPIIEPAPETYKKENVNPEPVEIPADTVVPPTVNPNDPENVGIEKGFKRPSITDVKYAYTQKQFKALMESYKARNPEKYRMKKSALEAKLKMLPN